MARTLSMLVMIFSVCFGTLSSPPQETGNASVLLDGAYEFVSETTIVTSPKAMRRIIVAPEWRGLWLFQGNHFSVTLMKKGRLYSTYPKFHEDLGYDSSAGTFTIDSKNIWLTRQMGLHPFSSRRLVALTYELRGETLTLTEALHPYPENASKGQRITVLRKIS